MFSNDASRLVEFNTNKRKENYHEDTINERKEIIQKSKIEKNEKTINRRSIQEKIIKNEGIKWKLRTTFIISYSSNMFQENQ